MKNSVFVFYALSRCQPESDQLRQSAPLYLSSREQTDQMASHYLSDYAFLYDNETDRNCLYCLLAEEYLLNAVYPQKLSTLVYSPQGALMNTSDYRVGEIVESACGERLSLGIVAEPPASFSDAGMSPDETEDCYAVLSYPSLEMDYRQSALMFEPRQKVTEGIEEVLREALQEYLTVKK